MYTDAIQVDIMFQNLSEVSTAGTYDVYYCTNGVEYKTTATYQVVDGLILNDIQTGTLAANCTEFDAELNITGYSDVSNLATLSITMKDENDHILATSDGKYKKVEKQNMGDQTDTVLAHMVVTEGATLSKNSSVYFTFEDSGSKPIIDAAGVVEGSISNDIQDATMTNLTFGEASKGEINLSLARVNPDDIYSITYVRGYSNGSSRGTEIYHGKITTNTLALVLENTDGAENLTTWYGYEDITIMLYAENSVAGDASEKLLEMRSFANPYADIGNEQNTYVTMHPSYVSAGTSSIDFTINVPNMPIDYDGSVPDIKICQYDEATEKEIEQEATNVNILRDVDGSYIFTGALVIPTAFRNPTHNQDVLIRINEQTPAVFSVVPGKAIRGASSRWKSGYNPEESLMTIHSMADVVLIDASAVGFSDTPEFTLVDENDPNTIVHATKADLLDTDPTGEQSYRVTFAAEEMKANAQSTFLLQGTDGSTKVTAGHFQYNSELREQVFYNYKFRYDSEQLHNSNPVDYTNDIMYNFKSRYTLSEDRKEVTTSLKGEPANYKNVPAAKLKAFYQSLEFRDNGTTVAVTAVKLADFAKMEYQAVMFDLTLSAPLTGSHYEIYNSKTGEFVDDLWVSSADTTSLYANATTLRKGYIEANGLPQNAVCTFSLYQGYNCVMQDIPLTYVKNEDKYSFNSSDGALFFDIATLQALPYGNYDMVVYVNGVRYPFTYNYAVANFALPPTFEVFYDDAFSDFVMGKKWKWDGKVVGGRCLQIELKNVANGYRYIRYAKTEEALDDGPFMLWDPLCAHRYEIPKGSKDGMYVVYFELAKDASGKGAMLYPLTFYYCSDNNYGINGVEKNTGYHPYNEPFTISVTAEHQFAKPYVQFYNEQQGWQSDYFFEAFCYIGVVNGEHTYELTYNRWGASPFGQTTEPTYSRMAASPLGQTTAPTYSRVAVSSLGQTTNAREQVGALSKASRASSLGQTTKARVFLSTMNSMNTSNNPDDESYQQGYLRSDVVEFDLVVGDLTEITVPQFSQPVFVNGNEISNKGYYVDGNSFTLEGYATANAPITITENGKAIANVFANADHAFKATLTNLTEGTHKFTIDDGTFAPITVYVVVDTSNPEIAAYETKLAALETAPGTVTVASYQAMQALKAELTAFNTSNGITPNTTIYPSLANLDAVETNYNTEIKTVLDNYKATLNSWSITDDTVHYTDKAIVHKMVEDLAVLVKKGVELVADGTGKDADAIVSGTQYSNYTTAIAAVGTMETALDTKKTINKDLAENWVLNNDTAHDKAATDSATLATKYGLTTTQEEQLLLTSAITAAKNYQTTVESAVVDVKAKAQELFDGADKTNVDALKAIVEKLQAEPYTLTDAELATLLTDDITVQVQEIDPVTGNLTTVTKTIQDFNLYEAYAKAKAKCYSTSTKPAVSEEESFWRDVAGALAASNNASVSFNAGNYIAVPSYIWQLLWNSNRTLTLTHSDNTYTFKAASLPAGFNFDNGHNLTEFTPSTGANATVSTMPPQTDNPNTDDTTANPSVGGADAEKPDVSGSASEATKPDTTTDDNQLDDSVTDESAVETVAPKGVSPLVTGLLIVSLVSICAAALLVINKRKHVE